MGEAVNRNLHVEIAGGPKWQPAVIAGEVGLTHVLDVGAVAGEGVAPVPVPAV